MTELYWQVGNAINQNVLDGKCAEYGADVVRSLSRRPTEAYGRGWSAQQLRHCMQLTRTLPHDEKFSALRRELSRISIKAIMYIDDPLARESYAEMSKLNHWSSRTLNLGLHDSYSKRDLESSILAEIQQFITDLGNDFAFLDRQKRITIDGEDYDITLSSSSS